MNCQEFELALHPYVDGELPVGEMTAADAHTAACWPCQALARQEREFRQLLGCQPREAAPDALRARIRTSLRRHARRSVVRLAFIVPALTAAAAALLVVALLPAFRSAPSLVSELVDKHIAYAQLERPAELASSDPVQIAQWFQVRASLHVRVPDYSPAGIRLVGARITDAEEREAAYLLYEKGHTLLSVFMLRADSAEPSGRRVSFRGYKYVAGERKGYRTIAWIEGRTLFGLVSSLDDDALLECADRLRLERTRQARL